MNPELITRLISLVEKTGDKVVLADPQTGKAVVVMDLAAYERILAGGQQAETRAETAPEKEVVPAVRTNGQNSQKTALFKGIVSKKAKAPEAPAEAVPMSGSADLTQEELLDKINREIAAWKVAQEKKRSDELKAAVRTAPPFEASAIIEEEERFYLEPIE